MSDPDEDMWEEELFLWLNPVARISRQAEAEKEMFGCADKSTCWEGIEAIAQEAAEDNLYEMVERDYSPEALAELLKNPNEW